MSQDFEAEEDPARREEHHQLEQTQAAPVDKLAPQDRRTRNRPGEDPLEEAQVLLLKERVGRPDRGRRVAGTALPIRPLADRPSA